MKICIINNLYPPYARGGAEQVVRKTVEDLLAKGLEVVLITTAPKDGGVRQQSNNLTIRSFKPWNVFFYTRAHEHNVLLRFLWHCIDIFHIGSAQYIRSILKTEKPDVVHTHNLMGVGFLIPRVIQKLKIRHVHTVHDVQLVEPSGIILKSKEKSWRYTGLPTKIYSWVMKKLFASPDVVISPSQFLLDFYTSRGFFSRSKTVLVRNPLTLDFGLQGNEEWGMRNGFELTNHGMDGMFRFLYLGQIEEHKGIYLLVQAFSRISNAQLHIVGDGSQLEKIKHRTMNNTHIHYYGRLNRERLPELFSTMNMTVVPSLCYENSPTVIFESLYFGVPVLASKIEGIAELIDEGKNGYTFEAGNVKSLEEKMQWCIEHKAEIAQVNTKNPISRRSDSEYVEELLRLYD